MENQELHKGRLPTFPLNCQSRRFTSASMTELRNASAFRHLNKIGRVTSDGTSLAILSSSTIQLWQKTLSPAIVIHSLGAVTDSEGGEILMQDGMIHNAPPRTLAMSLARPFRILLFPPPGCNFGQWFRMRLLVLSFLAPPCILLLLLETTSIATTTLSCLCHTTSPPASTHLGSTPINLVRIAEVKPITLDLHASPPAS